MEEFRFPANFQRAIKWIIIASVLTFMGFSVYRAVSWEMRPRDMVFIGKAVFRADVANSGSPSGDVDLSRRGSLGKDEALLVEFDSDKKWAATMKGVSFPIDIIWLDKNRVVVHVERDVQPDIEPYQEYLPKSVARYIMKVSSGQAKSWGISPGMEAKFGESRANL